MKQFQRSLLCIPVILDRLTACEENQKDRQICFKSLRITQENLCKLHFNRNLFGFDAFFKDQVH